MTVGRTKDRHGETIKKKRRTSVQITTVALLSSDDAAFTLKRFRLVRVNKPDEHALRYAMPTNSTLKFALSTP
ncbi:hypothetical protein AWB81_02333 [Caballeronia arationis]|uniref:Uncharacterized protein n=1 Tax=Caballeronia arationis TaxID=1777142 RepID=A0A7Z7IDJ8_9BURK|nr:hypothetical protein [Caballeronia arationis]SAK63328.1 hypothetical protein AWB81_02333 [Caballeronia arationis]SOE88773.1 hypothetical protein SAMN05446927_7396 [Caballeronia arationis]